MTLIYSNGELRIGNLIIKTGIYCVKIGKQFFLPEDFNEESKIDSSETCWNKKDNELYYYSNACPKTYWTPNLIINNT